MTHPVLPVLPVLPALPVTPMEGLSQTSRLMAAGDAAAQLALAELPGQRRS